MGGNTSEPIGQTFDKFDILTKEDRSKDEKFWSDVVLLSAKIKNDLPPSKLIYDIAKEFPQNIISFYINSVNYLEFTTNSRVNDKLPESFLNQIYFIFNLNNIILSVLFQNEFFKPILDEIMKDPISKMNINKEISSSTEDYDNESSDGSKEDSDPKIVFKEGEIPEEIAKGDDTENNDRDVPKKISKSNVLQDDLAKTSLFYRFLHCINQFLFMEGFTLPVKSKIWLDTKETDDYYTINRKNVFHTLIYCLNLPYFCKESGIECYPMPKFIPRTPYHILTKSILNYLILFPEKLNADILSTDEFDLIQNVLFLYCYMLPSNIFEKELDSFSFKNFCGCFTGMLEIYEANPISPLYQEFYTFFFVIAKSVKFFAKDLYDSGLTPKYIYTLLQSIQNAYEILGESQLVEILLRTLHIILSEPDNVKAINIPYKNTLQAQFKAHKGTLCDLTVEIMINVLNSDNFCIIALNILHLISELDFSLFPSQRLISYVTSLIPSQNLDSIEVRRKEVFDFLLLIIVSTMLKETKVNIFLLIALYKERKIFRNLFKKHYKSDYLAIIVVFNKLVKEKLKELTSESISADTARNSIQNIDIYSMFKENIPQLNVKLECNLSFFWVSWIEILFKKLSKTELQHLGLC